MESSDEDEVSSRPLSDASPLPCDAPRTGPSGGVEEKTAARAKSKVKKKKFVERHCGYLPIQADWEVHDQ